MNISTSAQLTAGIMSERYVIIASCVAVLSALLTKIEHLGMLGAGNVAELPFSWIFAVTSAGFA